MSAPSPATGQLRAAVRQRLAARLAQPDGPAAPAIPRRSDPQAPSRLSFGQERLWLIEALEPEHNPYHMRVAMRVDGRVDPDALRAALAGVLRRHEVLRSAFRPGPDGPVQVLRDDAEVPLLIQDTSAAPDPWQEALRLAAQHARTPFDLSVGPPLRAQLVRAGQARWLLQVVLHHLVCDGWSLGVFVRELAALYAAGPAGADAALPPLPVQYADFAAWQRDRLTGPDGEAELAYWQRRLADAPRVLALPTDRPRPMVSTFRGDRVPVVLAPELAARVRERCAEEGVTAFMFLLTAFTVLLARYSGSTDVVVGAPVAGRSRVELEGLIGFFVNTLVLRTDLSGDPSVRAALDRVRRSTLDAFEHQEVPFERLVERLAPQRSLSHSPLFQALFVLQNLPAQRVRLPECAMEPLDTHDGTAKFDLSMNLREEGGGLAGALEFSTDLFDAPTAARMAEHFVRLVDQMCAHPCEPVLRLPMLSPAQRHELVVERNRAPVTPSGSRRLHEVFAGWARRSPQKVALVCGARSLTYGELNGWADRVAAALRGAGVGRGTLVGLSVRRSVELVVGILAILKAGGGYVPMDPGYPVQRLAYLVGDAEVRLMLTETAVADRFDSVPTLCIDEVPATGTGDGEAGTAPGPEGSTSDLAYVIYTSGSTGRPKGVMIEHRNVLALFLGAADLLCLGSDDVWLLFHSASFDVSVWELWGAFLFGGRLVVADADQVRDPAALAALVVEHGVTRLGLTTSAFSALATAGPDLSSVSAPLRSMVFAGEPMTAAAFAAVTGPAWSPGADAVNMYGTTETTVHASYHRIPPGAPPAELARVGGPLPGYRFYVVDAFDEPVPVGVPGELLIGGPGVARGYLRRPALTAQRFVPDPFGAPGERLYRTGDVVRWLPGGGLEFVGRADQQVKVRGFRVEPGEVESALAALPSVGACAVIAREDRAGDRQLVGYVVPAAGTTLSAADLRAGLSRVLPEHLVPTGLVLLDALPLTGNGKLDRAALPAPDGSRDLLGVGYEPPGTEQERLLVEVWADVLAVPADRVGIRDNFFELGGDSLRAARIVAHLRDRGWDLALRDLFLHQTVAALAQRLSALPAAVGVAAGEPALAEFDLLTPQDRAALAAMLTEPTRLTGDEAGEQS